MSRQSRVTMQTLASKQGSAFTLIELTVVMGVLAVLLSITLAAINPAAQFKKANDTKRISDVNALVNSINQYQSNNNGSVPAGITTTVKQIGAGTTALVDLCTILVPSYLASVPEDPIVNGGAPITSPCPASYATGYYVQLSPAGGNRVSVFANSTQVITPTISVTK